MQDSAVAQHQLAAVPAAEALPSLGRASSRPPFVRRLSWPFLGLLALLLRKVGVLTPATGTSAESPQGAGAGRGCWGHRGAGVASVFLGTTTRQTWLLPKEHVQALKDLTQDSRTQP